MNSIILKSIFRGLRKQKLIALINLIGLSIGLTLVMFIAFYLRNELQADKFHQNAKSIYRIEEHIQSQSAPLTPLPMAGWLKDNFPDVELTTRISPLFEAIKYVTADNNKIEVKNPLFVDSTFFKMFSFPIAYGDKTGGFSNRNAVVLTASLAQKLFGKENPLGRTITFCGKGLYTVTAVLKKSPPNSSMQFDLLLPISSMADFQSFDEKNWGSSSYQTFIVLNSDVNTLSGKVNILVKKDFPDFTASLSFVPLPEIHFSQDSPFDSIFKHGSKTELYIFLIIALVVLLIATINFINLNVALSSSRFKGNGIRKIEGASQFQLVAGYLLESVLISLSSVVVAVFLIELFFSQFNHLLSNPLERTQLRQLWFYFALAGMGLLTGLIAGAYPAYKFSCVPLTSFIRNKYDSQIGSDKWSNRLVVFQFAISIVLITSTLFLNRQIDFIQTRQLGFDKSQVLFVPLTDDLKSKKEIIMDQLKDIPEIENVCTSDHIPGQTFAQWGQKYSVNGEEKDIRFYYTGVSDEYLKTLGLQILQGRNFDPTRPADQYCFLVNESFVKKYGLNNLSESILCGHKIIGTVKNFNFGSLYKDIEPLAIRYNNEDCNMLMIRTKSSTFIGVSSLIGTINRSILKVAPNAFFDVQFLDNLIQNQYINEVKNSHLMSYFSFFAIFISCLGLFAMATLVINKRTKEIGIRKINGAKVSEVITMLNRDFVKWVAIAIVIATPIAYYAMVKWLEGFAYKTSLSWWIFALAGLLALGIALLTVSWQSWRAATRNPVEALRYE
jgi:putative ABC transport system permease protein